jgi:hypothetical protein
MIRSPGCFSIDLKVMRLLKDLYAHGTEVDYRTVSMCCFDYAALPLHQADRAASAPFSQSAQARPISTPLAKQVGSLPLQAPSAGNLDCHAGRVLPAHRAHADATEEGSVERRYGNPALRISFLMTFFCDLATLRVNTNPTPMGRIRGAAIERGQQPNRPARR